jgi:hypothetical protein
MKTLSTLLLLFCFLVVGCTPLRFNPNTTGNLTISAVCGETSATLTLTEDTGRYNMRKTSVSLTPDSADIQTTTDSKQAVGGWNELWKASAAVLGGIFIGSGGLAP